MLCLASSTRDLVRFAFAYLPGLCAMVHSYADDPPGPETAPKGPHNRKGGNQSLALPRSLHGCSSVAHQPPSFAKIQRES